MIDPKQYKACGNGSAWLLCVRCWRIWAASDPRHDCRVPYARVAELETALRDVRDLICGTASIILMPGRKTLDDASVSVSVVTNAQKACERIAAALESKA